MLEYNFANAISRLSRKEKPMIAYATGNGEPFPGQMIAYDLFENVLKPEFRLFTFNLNEQPLIPEMFKVLMLVKPATGFSEVEKLKIDQFVMHGGKLLVFVDRLNAEMDSLQVKNEVVAFDRGLKLEDLLFRYGVRVNPDLVMDLQCDFLPFDVNGNGQFELLPWNYFPLLSSANNHPVNKNLGFVTSRFINSLDTVEAPGIKKTVLLHSSANARTIHSPALISGRENKNAPEDEKFRTANIPIAYLLEGKFRSLFSNRLSQNFRDSLQNAGSDFLSECLKSTKVIVVGDGDMVLNSVVKGEPIPMGMNPFTYTEGSFPVANKIFLQNCLDYLVDEGGLSEAKAKDYTVRFLDPKKVKSGKTFWQFMDIGLPVAIIILINIYFTMGPGAAGIQNCDRYQ
jgi:gliding-associated putative ABC transporter substrate-binding component GldG